MLRDIDTFISGINQYLSINSPSTAPWTRNDVYALNALKGQFVGQGGGDEARRSQFLGGLTHRFGQTKGKSIFNDLRQFKNPEKPHQVSPATLTTGTSPRDPAPAGSVILDPGSFQPTSGRRPPRTSPSRPPPEPARASNTLMIDAEGFGPTGIR